MNILLIIIPATLFLVCVFIVLFLAAANEGQFDDLETPAHRILESGAENNKTTTKKGEAILDDEK